MFYGMEPDEDRTDRAVTAALNAMDHGESESLTRLRDASARAQETLKIKPQSPAWLLPVALALILIGVAWVITFVATITWPIPGISAWNIAIGLTIVGAGLMMLTRWQ